jgi:peroxiredoxin
MSTRIELNKPAPEFILQDFHGREIRLADYHARRNVLLIFNRGLF